MTSTTPNRPLRLWPGVVAAALVLVLRYILPAIFPDAGMIGIFGGMFFVLVILVWWLFFSRAAWSERITALLVIALAMVAAYRIVHISIRGGMMGFMLIVYALPVLLLALVAWAVVAGRFSPAPRRVAMIAMIFAAAGSFALLRTDGVTGGGGAQLHWRWTPTAEQILLAAEPGPTGPTGPTVPTSPTGPTVPTGPATSTSASSTAATTSVAPVGPGGPVGPVGPDGPGVAVWPGFRGPDRDGVISGLRIETDWAKAPPAVIWRRAIGPGWSSFAVDGDIIYTQEQRGEHELVASYRLSTGAPVWQHRTNVRFWESNAGAGPRGTPTIAGGRVYALGATGVLNVLDKRTGAKIWSRNAGEDTTTEVPTWGFSSSPLVIDDVVIVAASGKLVAYDINTGTPKWFGPKHRGSYSSPHRVVIGGVTQVLMESGDGITSVAPDTGTVLWEHEWYEGGTTIVQPALLPDGDVLIHGVVATGGVGVRRLALTKSGSTWNVTERWTSNGLKPYFNDLVVHKGHVYGFDGNILACVDLADGKRKWKGGRYGAGQLVLLPDSDALLVISEDGDLALVGAAPDQYREISKVPALAAKTWNHPVVIGDVLLVRNGEEMMAMRLARK